MRDVIVVGSGAAGTWAAHQCAAEGLDVLLLDVGHRAAPGEPLRGHLLDLRRSDPRQGEYLVGAGFESLHNVARDYLSPKLKSPRFRFVTAEADSLGPVDTQGFAAVQSFAYGGLANAWGAGAFRYTAEELADFPLPGGSLDPHYDELTRAIGISGDHDDLAEHFGTTEGLQPPLALDRLATRLLAGYARRRSAFREAGFSVGRSRLAVLSRPLESRGPCRYDNLSFWEPRLDYVYVPGHTLDGLIAADKVRYLDRRLVVRFEEGPGAVKVRARNLRTEAEEVFESRRLVLAAGALNSARLVLQSFSDFETRLPILDNQPSMVPFVHPLLVGDVFDRSSHGLGQLNVVYRGHGAPGAAQGTFYSYGGLLGSEVVADFPLPMRGAVSACKLVLPAFALVTFFYPDAPRPGNYVSLSEDGSLRIRYEQPVTTGALERLFIAQMRRCGFLSHTALVRTPGPGQGIHYAGTLPMGRGAQLKYATEASGRLSPTRAVFVADAAVFPSLPAKNHTLTIMANAMRVAREVAASLGDAP